MLKITTMDDLVKSSMNILEPSPVDATGNDREDGMNIHFYVTAKLSPHLIYISYCIDGVFKLTCIHYLPCLMYISYCIHGVVNFTCIHYFWSSFYPCSIVIIFPCWSFVIAWYVLYHLLHKCSVTWTGVACHSNFDVKVPPCGKGIYSAIEMFHFLFFCVRNQV